MHDLSHRRQPESKEVTICEYDIAELKKLIQQTVVGVAILGFLHFKFDFVQPLILQSIFPFKNLLSSPLAKIHIFGKSAESGELKRPWKAPSPFG